MTTKQILKTLDAFSNAFATLSVVAIVVLTVYHVFAGPIGFHILKILSK